MKIEDLLHEGEYFELCGEVAVLCSGIISQAQVALAFSTVGELFQGLQDDPKGSLLPLFKSYKNIIIKLKSYKPCLAKWAWYKERSVQPSKLSCAICKGQYMVLDRNLHVFFTNAKDSRLSAIALLPNFDPAAIEVRIHFQANP